MNIHKNVYLGLLIALAVGGVVALIAFQHGDSLKASMTQLLYGSSRQNPYCFSWTECPEVINISPYTIEASYPTAKTQPEPAAVPEKPLPAPKKPTPAIAPTAVPTATPEPVLTVMEEPDPTPVLRIPEIQYHLQPLEDNSNPGRPTPNGSSGPPMPPEVPQPLPLTPPVPERTPARQFDGGDLVQWVAGGGIVNQGQVKAFEYSDNTQMWLYDVEKANGHLWQGLEENRMTIVTKNSLPFDTSVVGRAVMAFDLETGEVLGEGVVEQVIKMPDHWSYKIRRGDCSSFQTGDARIVLIDFLAQKCQSTPVPVPPVEPMPPPTPTPTPMPDPPTPTPKAPTVTPETPDSKLVANAGPDQTVSGPSPVNIHLSGEANVTDYTCKWYNQWELLRSEDCDTTIEVDFGHNDPEPGTKRSFTLVVKDDQGRTAEDKVIITLGEEDPGDKSHTFIGIVTIDGELAPEGTWVYSDIPSLPLQNRAVQVGENGEYTMTLEGAEEGEQITFGVDAECAHGLGCTTQIATWKPGGNDVLDLVFVSLEPGKPTLNYDPIELAVMLRPFDATGGATGSATATFIENQAAIKIAESDGYDLQSFNVGLLETKEGDTHWYVISGSYINEQNPQAEVSVCRGSELWEQFHSCVGAAGDLVSTDEEYKFRISPVHPAMWDVEILPPGEDWVHLVTFTAQPGQQVNHSVDSVLAVIDDREQEVTCGEFLEEIFDACPDEGEDDSQGEEGSG